MILSEEIFKTGKNGIFLRFFVRPSVPCILSEWDCDNIPYHMHTYLYDAFHHNNIFPYRLQDQFPNVSAHTQKGIDFLEKYGSFIRDRCAIEIEYASKLRRLTKNYQPKGKKSDDEDNE